MMAEELPQRRIQVILTRADEEGLLRWAAVHDPQRRMSWSALLLHHVRASLRAAEREGEG